MNSEMFNEELIKALDSLPHFSFLESLYARNEDSPIFHKKKTSRVYVDLFSKIEEIIVKGFQNKNVRNVRDLPFSSLFSLAEMIVFVVPRTPDVLLHAMRPNYLEHFFPCHFLNVALLSVKLGAQMKMENHELTELGVAALLHDIGMTLIDSGSFMHDRALSRSDRKTMEEHPVAAHQHLAKIKDDFSWLLRVVFEEHKRADGSGYPKGARAELHEYSKIIGLVDVFEALTHRRLHRQAFHPADAIRMVIKMREKEFSADQVKNLVETVGLYPIGSFVYLNNEKVAQVMEMVPGNPLRPKVQIVEKKSDGVVIADLSKETNIYIAGIAYDENYRAMNPKLIS